jgi:hypothetical protein
MTKPGNGPRRSRRRKPTSTNAPARRRELIARLDAILESRDIDFLEWAERIPTAKGDVLNFKKFPFQPELYQTLADPSVPEVVVMKSVQVGISELLARLTLYYPAVHGSTALYVFPALKQMQDFSVTRVDRLLENSAYLRRITDSQGTPTWNKGLKRVGSGFVYYRGSESKNDLIAVDADVLALDEYDQLQPQNIPEAEKRITGSKLGLIRRVGIPSDPEYGIAKKYEDSDQRRWLVKCGRRGCKEGWQDLTFHENVRWDEPAELIENPRVVCRSCERPLNVLTGKWVAARPDRPHPGFHVHRLMIIGERNLRTVIEASKQTQPARVRSFWNNDLGLPYTEKSAGLDRLAIAAAISAATSHYGRPLEMAANYNGTNLVTMGVDVASTRALNVRISEHLDPITQAGRKRALWIGTVDSFEALPRLMDRYRVSYACVDHLPETRLALGLAQLFPGRIYLAHYARQSEPIVLNSDLRVSVQRVPALDGCMAVMREQRNLLPAELPPGYVEHMISPRRVIKRDEFDQVTVAWESRGPDDYFQAEVYDLIATEVAKIRHQMHQLSEPQIWRLDDVLSFERSHVADYDNMDYDPGPAMPDEFGRWTPNDFDY